LSCPKAGIIAKHEPYLTSACFAAHFATVATHKLVPAIYIKF